MFWDKFLKPKKKSKNTDIETEKENNAGHNKGEDALYEAQDMEDSGAISGDELSSLLGDDAPRPASSSFAIMPDGNQDFFSEGAEDDDIIMDDIPEGKLAELQNMFKMLDSNVELQEEIESKLTVGGELADTEESLDDAIQRALEQDAEEVGNTDLSSQSIEILSDVSVYDTVQQEGSTGSPVGEEEEEQGKKLIITEVISRLYTMPQKNLFIIMGGLIGLIMVFGVIGTVLAMNADAADGSLTKNGIVITQPTYSSNNANYIFTAHEGMLNDKPYKVQKILIDPEATVFYFDNKLEPAGLVITMTDGNEKTYYLDLNELKPQQEGTNQATRALRLEPLDEGVKKFTLSIQDPSTKDSTEYKFVIRNGIVYPPARYLNEKVDVLNDGGGAMLLLEGARFSSAGSSIYYKLENRDDSRTVMMRNEDNKQAIFLNEGSLAVISKQTLPDEYVSPLNNTVLGRMDFEGATGLQSNMNIIFKNLYEVYNLYEQIPVSPLFNNKEEAQIVLEIGHYSMTLERMKRFKDKFVMVFHTEDNDVLLQEAEEADKKEAVEVGQVGGPEKVTVDNYANRVETQIDVQLQVITADGKVLNIDGVNRSVKEGTDVVFEDEEHAEALANAPLGDLMVKINLVHIKCNDITVPVELKKASGHLDSTRKVMDAFVEDAFHTRLAYKSSQAAQSEIAGFSPELLSDKKLMNYYKPEQVTEPKYTAQVIASTISANEVEGIVREIWYGEGAQPIFYLTHAVVVAGDENGWQIVEDVILK